MSFGWILNWGVDDEFGVLGVYEDRLFEWVDLRFNADYNRRDIVGLLSWRKRIGGSKVCSCVMMEIGLFYGLRGLNYYMF